MLKLKSVLLAFCLCLHASASDDSAARVVTSQGDVKAGGQSLRPGDGVGAGAKVVTGDNSSVKLLLADGSIVDLGAKTSFAVENAGPDGATARLDYGMARSSIQKKMGQNKPRFQMRTKTSVLAVRGTEFVVQSAFDIKKGEVKEQVTVLDGQVMAAVSSQERLINQGQQLFIPGQDNGENAFDIDPKLVKIEQLDKGVLDKLAGQSRIQENTFREHIQISDDKPLKPGAQSVLMRVAASASKDSDPERDDRPNRLDPDRKDPMDPTRVGKLNAIDQSGAELATINGARVDVIFIP